MVHWGSAHGSRAAKIGMQAWQDMREGKGVMSSQQCDDSSGIADKMALVKLPRCPEADTHGATCALVLASHSDDAVRASFPCVYTPGQYGDTDKAFASAGVNLKETSAQA